MEEKIVQQTELVRVQVENIRRKFLEEAKSRYYDYNEYRKDFFKRSSGLKAFNPEVIEKIENTVLCICGAGAAGSETLKLAVDMGFRKIILADPDTYDGPNIPRQRYACIDTIDMPKVLVAAEGIFRKNPFIELKCYSEGITEENYKEIIDAADIVIDGLDVSLIGLRRTVFGYALSTGKMVISCAPFGINAILHIFSPAAMNFEKYFNFERKGNEYIDFCSAKAVLPFFVKQLDPKAVKGRQGPSTALAMNAVATLIMSNILKYLNGEKIVVAPGFHYYDIMANKIYSPKLIKISFLRKIWFMIFRHEMKRKLKSAG